MSLTVLEVQNLCKSFGVTKANQNVSLTLRAGEVHSLAGENGSGKSTLISQIVGIQKPDSGEILLEGKPYAPSSPLDAHAAGIGFVVQELGLIDDFDGSMNMFLGNFAQFRKFGIIDTRKMRKAATKELSRWNLGEVPMRKKAANLSIEKRKFIEITKSLSVEPKVWILDETTQSLSHDTKQRLYQIIEEKKKQGCAILMITHDLEEMCRISDRVTVLRDGRSVVTLEKEEIDENKVRNLMVGREVQADYYRTDNECLYNEDEVVMRVENISDQFYQDVSFELHKGEILGFCGLSDAGIHEIGKAVFALEPPKTGRVMLPGNGAVIRKPLDATKNKMGYVPKDRDSEALMLNASIRDNIFMPSVQELQRTVGYISPSECTKLAKEARDRLSIRCTGVKQAVSSLSGGNKQKVNLGRWLIKDIDILILDCPTRGVDVGVKAYIYHLMKEMKEKGMAMILISDELTEVLGMSDRIAIMREGKIVGFLRRDEDFTQQKVVEGMI